MIQVDLNHGPSASSSGMLLESRRCLIKLLG